MLGPPQTKRLILREICLRGGSPPDATNRLDQPKTAYGLRFTGGVKPTILCALLICLLAFPAVAADCDTTWLRLDRGLEYRAVDCLGETEALDVHVVRIDPDDWHFNTAVVEFGTARGIAESKDAAFAINANFFDKERRPLGLVVRSGDEVYSARESNWQSIFLIDETDRPRIILPSSWEKYRKGAKVAVQAGPRLVINGHVSGARNNYRAERVGVCIQPDGDLLFFATPRDRKLHVREMARIAQRAEKNGGLNCRNAMLFDGGHSVNFFVEGDEKTVSVSNGRVPVFVYATPR
ncbi:MAG TPA: phosphodiester glycosidase family protein [Thermoanaerobaculia bacterium]|nr:phosphodiester glycosidase family protein [Thermoanaerobaculia bacterium]